MPLPTFNQLWLQVRAGVYGWVKGGAQGQPRPIAVDNQGRIIISGSTGTSGVSISTVPRIIDPAHHDEPAANTAAVVPLAAPGAGSKWVIGNVTWSYDGEPSGGTLTIQEGATTLFKVDIPNMGVGPLDRATPIAFGDNKAVTVTLAAAGAGISGIIDVHAWTE